MSTNLLPDEQVRQALQAANLAGYFSSLAPSHQDEYLRWVYEAKKEETKQRRIVKMIDMLQEKRGV